MAFVIPNYAVGSKVVAERTYHIVVAGKIRGGRLGRLADWQTGRLADWQTGRLADWQTG